ncbi:MAG: rod shape-determining protein MreD [Streptococcus minor]|nr:rod shape-determining protein MreD [Streptococcus minor]
MKKQYLAYLMPLIAFLVFLLDSQLSTLLINWAPGSMMISSHILLMVAIFLSFQLPLIYNIVLFSIMGLVYDLYYFGILGIFITLLPLVVYLIYYFYQNLPFKTITNHIILVVILFIFKFFAFALARLFLLTNLSMFIFVFNDLMPTLVFNSILLLLLQPLLKSLFGITNKT